MLAQFRRFSAAIAALMSTLTLTVSAQTQLNVLPDGARSAHFVKVASRLDLGGQTFMYIDMAGLTERMGKAMNNLVQDLQQLEGGAKIPFPIQLDPIFQDLGIYNLEAFGTSSYAEPEGVFRNKAYIYMPDGRSGIFNVFGNQPHAFDSVAMATGDTDLVLSMDFNGKEVLSIVENLITRIMGDAGKMVLNMGLMQPLNPAAATPADPDAADAEPPTTWMKLFESSNTRISVVARLGPAQQIPVPNMDKPLNVPKFEVVVSMDNYGWLFDEIAKATGDGEGIITEAGTLRILQVPEVGDNSQVEAFGYKPALVSDKETGAFHVTTSIEYFNQCNARPDTLKDQPDFQAATTGLPTQGSGFVYISPDSFKQMNYFVNAFTDAAPESKFILNLYSIYLPFLTSPPSGKGAASVTVYEDDGVFSDSRTPFSSYGNASMGGAESVFVIGVLAAMAIPAFNKVRQTSQEKAVLNNLRQIASAADQYFIEEGETIVTLDKLIGPDKYIRSLEPIAGEDYSVLSPITAGFTELSVTLSDGRVITYGY